MLGKCLEHWNQFGLPIYVVSESQHRKETEPVVEEYGASGLWLRASNRGLGYSMNVLDDHAKEQKLQVYVKTDDDHSAEGNLDYFLEMAVRRDVLGVGAAKRIYGLYMRGTKLGDAIMKNRTGLFLHTGSVGYGTFAVNVFNSKRVGGFDPRIAFGEDSDFARRGIGWLGIPWYIYTGFKATPMALAHTLQGEGGGGHASLGNRNETMLRSWKVMFKEWPEYMTDPDGVTIEDDVRRKFRVKWRKMFDQFVDIESWPPENIQTREPWDWRGR